MAWLSGYGVGLGIAKVTGSKPRSGNEFHSLSCQIQCVIFHTDELHLPANERPPFGLKVKERLDVTRDGDSREHVDLPLALSRRFQLYGVAASTFKMDRFDRMRFERSSSTIQPKLLVYQPAPSPNAKPAHC